MELISRRGNAANLHFHEKESDHMTSIAIKQFFKALEDDLNLSLHFPTGPSINYVSNFLLIFDTSSPTSASISISMPPPLPLFLRQHLCIVTPSLSYVPIFRAFELKTFISHFHFFQNLGPKTYSIGMICFC